jgi:adenylyltransferase/sulfurtransferase
MEPTREPRPFPELTAEETRRYGRHLILPEVGIEGQRRLKGAKVLLVGAGGLGSPLGLYLGAAGVGTLGVCDFDRVDETNLHRQLLHDTCDVGRSKVESARERIAAINPNVHVRGHEMQLRASNIRELIRGYDLVADGSDNFATRYVVNDACVLEKIPLVWGAVFQFEGQASVFGLPGGPCYRCLYPDPPPPGAVPNCAEGGVLGVLPGIIGLIQANEVLKLILGKGEPLRGRLLLFDALGAQFREVRLSRDPKCPVCGDAPTISEPVDYEGYCEFQTEEVGDSSNTQEIGVAKDNPYSIEVEELARRRADGDGLQLLDVRMDQELAIAALDGAIHIPLQQLPHRFAELDKDAELAVICHHGPRSGSAVRFLLEQGFRLPRNVEGGIDQYSKRVDPNLPRY